LDFLIKQYTADGALQLKHSYLKEQFSGDVRDRILERIGILADRGDYTLGAAVEELENKFTSLTESSYAIGVGSGTDALRLSLLSIGLEPNSRVLTPAMSFVATAGAIVGAGLRPEFCDIGEDLNLDTGAFSGNSSEISAIVPVHWAGRVMDLTKMDSQFPGIPVVEDACHAILGQTDGLKAGKMGLAAAFSFHPLKNLNVWGDGGIITTDDDRLADRVKLLRNHGQRDRDHIEIFGHNSRLDSIQAVVAIEMLQLLDLITQCRRRNSFFLDELLLDVPGITLLPRRDNEFEVFHLYQFRAQRRDDLVVFLRDYGIDAKVHYRIPLHLQEAARELGFQKGDFPNAERAAEELVSLPVHEYIQPSDVELMAAKIRDFYEAV
jgi:dTDP-3-amino-2,3,6-trideoxy-4-keto-D-glucose/dTDP-3-amino-3,4,6-trideoxy-alpha-D-glucose/dTDP-2,6-dideoxy-D-kanosamine transaminase